ncbi:MAG: cobalamin-binding protein [Candidatus Abyssobacteria bacterium SURF_17]|uniref:Cobalamin-binding protein n=1 Tax=Candidatus Abyssobacteria bacterium SURF_17 TaxID=2093361 RepID=A0A419EYR0_9BACT|nr:MAG: cobalamin-binding protein [Candidatus Abyssubacteria bacterium SURF_17]
MTNDAKKDELLKKLADGVLKFEEEEVATAANEVLALGFDAYEAIMNGLAKGMEEAGRLYEEEEYFVPELLLCADALYAGLNILRPHVKIEDRQKSRGVVVIGTVQGDVHDIGKNLVKMMFEVAGFEVHDLGKDVPLEKFVEEQLKTNAELVCLSAMMTTSMLGMERIIKMIREKNPEVKIMIGGAPITQEVVKKFGADGTANSASNALREALKMVASLRKMG